MKNIKGLISQKKIGLQLISIQSYPIVGPLSSDLFRKFLYWGGCQAAAAMAGNGPGL